MKVHRKLRSVLVATIYLVINLMSLKAPFLDVSYQLRKKISSVLLKNFFPSLCFILYSVLTFSSHILIFIVLTVVVHLNKPVSCLTPIFYINRNPRNRVVGIWLRQTASQNQPHLIETIPGL